MSKVFLEILNFFKGLYQANIENSVSALQVEHDELNYTFLVILLGSFVGVKTVPPLLSIELLTSLGDELKFYLTRAARDRDAFADLMSSLGGEW
ncbi:MAG: hypothetical protein QW680_04140 [Pyrobaculum sp.]